MALRVDDFIQAYPDQRSVYPVTRDGALARLEELRAFIAKLEDLTRFPEGTDGVILYALLWLQAQACPDSGDMRDMVRGDRALLDAGFDAIKRDLGQDDPLWR